MEKACALDPEYPRIWLEYDQLAARMNLPAEKRLEIMESHPAVTAGRDDLYLRYLTLLNDVGRYQEALGGLASRQFHPWEGGEGKVSSQYKYALTHLAMAKLDEKQPQEALKLLEATLSYPNNLGEGKLPNVPDNEAHYYMGLAYKQLGETEKAEEIVLFPKYRSRTHQNIFSQNIMEMPKINVHQRGVVIVCIQVSYRQRCRESKRSRCRWRWM